MVSALLDALGGLIGARWLQRFFRNKAEDSQKPWRTRATAYREVIVPASYEVAEARCRRALEMVGEERPVSIIGAIEAVTPATWRSSGTVIRLQLIPTQEGTRVDVAAWPGASLFDWGESRRVARAVIDGLGETLPAGATAYRR